MVAAFWDEKRLAHFAFNGWQWRFLWLWLPDEFMPLALILFAAFFGAKFYPRPFGNGAAHHAIKIMANWFWFSIGI